MPTPAASAAACAAPNTSSCSTRSPASLSHAGSVADVGVGEQRQVVGQRVDVAQMRQHHHQRAGAAAAPAPRRPARAKTPRLRRASRPALRSGWPAPRKSRHAFRVPRQGEKAASAPSSSAATAASVATGGLYARNATAEIAAAKSFTPRQSSIRGLGGRENRSPRPRRLTGRPLESSARSRGECTAAACPRRRRPA